MRSYASDHRTPLAWRHRDFTLRSPPSRDGYRSGSHPRAPPTPSETTTTSSDEREEVPMVRHGHHHHHHHHNVHSHRRSASRSRGSPHDHHHHHTEGRSQFVTTEVPYRNGGTLRSTRSVPALTLATWDGEPCPVHGHGVPLYPQPPPNLGNGSLRRHGSLFDVRAPFYPPPPAGLLPPPHMMLGPPLLDKKSFHGSLQMLGPFPPPFLPPMMRPRPFVFPAGAEPLPVRDPYKMRTPPPSGYAGSKAEDPYSVDQVCCRGHLIVLWIILAVVTIGVILGIVLGVTIA